MKIHSHTELLYVDTRLVTGRYGEVLGNILLQPPISFLFLACACAHRGVADLRMSFKMT
jgi:hypothetical protein